MTTLSFGGPYLGVMATRKKHVRKMPGRIAAATEDAQGRRGFVLTMQAREQHIRRSKATSNICTNQGLMVTAATIHMAALTAHPDLGWDYYQGLADQGANPQGGNGGVYRAVAGGERDLVDDHDCSKTRCGWHSRLRQSFACPLV